MLVKNLMSFNFFKIKIKIIKVLGKFCNFLKEKLK